MAHHPTRRDQSLGLWIALLTLFSIVIGISGGVLSWLAEPDVPSAVLAGGAAFAGTMVVGLSILRALRGG